MTDNELIATFMGHEIVYSMDGDKIVYIRTQNKSWPVSVNSMMYKNWDSLIDVIKKIQDEYGESEQIRANLVMHDFDGVYKSIVDCLRKYYESELVKK